MSYKILGKSVNRVDAIAKVTGKAKYAEDYFEREMLVGKVLRSTYTHAKIKNIFIDDALSLDGVEAVITYKEFT